MSGFHLRVIEESAKKLRAHLAVADSMAELLRCVYAKRIVNDDDSLLAHIDDDAEKELNTLWAARRALSSDKYSAVLGAKLSSNLRLCESGLVQLDIDVNSALVEYLLATLPREMANTGAAIVGKKRRAINIEALCDALEAQLASIINGTVHQ